MELLDVPAELTAERVLLCSDPRVGLRAVVAIDDTTLGPGFGGVRMRRFSSVGRAVDEAQRLARAMTAKNALAGIPYGGAKSVVLVDDHQGDRVGLMHRFGRFVADLGGAYLPGVDMGTTPADMRLMAEAGADTTCADQDPSPWTAAGILHAIESAVAFRFGVGSLAGVRVLVQGVGHVGESLARRLAAAGAIVDVADADHGRATAVADAVGGRVVSTGDVVGHECDVLAPCAVARVVSRSNIADMRCSIIAGGANDTLEDRQCAAALADVAILYVPDFVANSGGVRFVHARRSGWDHARTDHAIEEIGHRVSELLHSAAASEITPLAAAERRAAQLLDAR